MTTDLACSKNFRTTFRSFLHFKILIRFYVVLKITYSLEFSLSELSESSKEKFISSVLELDIFFSLTTYLQSFKNTCE